MAINDVAGERMDCIFMYILREFLGHNFVSCFTLKPKQLFKNP